VAERKTAWGIRSSTTDELVFISSGKATNSPSSSEAGSSVRFEQTRWKFADGDVALEWSSDWREGDISITCPDEEKEVVLLTGGHVRSYLNTTEVYPPIDTCSPPPLPTPRTRMVTFLTAGPNPSIATCGGVTGSEWDSTPLGDCLVLDVENQVWKTGVIGPLINSGNSHQAAVTMSDAVYVIGGFYASNKMEVLLAGTTQWQEGPPPPVDPWTRSGYMVLPCAVAISETSFLSMYGTSIIEFDTSSAGWKDLGTYPKLKIDRRYWPGCAKLGSKVIISGGGGNDPRSHKSTEILDLTDNTLSSGGDLIETRRHFHILNVNNKLLAIGGVGVVGWSPGNPTSSSVEEWDPSTSTWSKSSTGLEEERASFGALVVSKDLVCRP